MDLPTLAASGSQNGDVELVQTQSEEAHVNNYPLRPDLAKNSFSSCGVDAHERGALRKTLHRHELLAFFAQQSPAMVAMESGSGAHYWARALIAMGHDARLIDPRFVAPYRQRGRCGKNDVNAAEAICEAAGGARMRFVPIKTADQQALLIIHRLRAMVVADHTRTRSDRKSRWIEGLKARKGWNQATVALANKHARIARAMLANHQPYQLA